MAKSSLNKKFDQIKKREEEKTFSTKKRSRIVSKFLNNRLAVIELIIFTIIVVASIFAPLFNEIVLAFCITGPSAIGSENGNPNSMMSVPPLTNPLTIDNVVFSFGKPAMMYEINAFSFLDFNSLNLS